MKPKKKSVWQVVSISLSQLIVVALLAPGCNSKDKNGTETSDTTKSTSTNITGTQEKVARVDLAGTPLPFYTLKLDSASLVALFANNSVKKIIVQVIDSSTDNSTALGLIAYGAKVNNQIVTGPIGLSHLSNPETSFDTGPVILGDQELPLKAVKGIYFIDPGGGPIAPANFHSLKFVPNRDGDNHLFYTVTKLSTTETGGNANTNPSPPATPCTTGCDQ
jgi:hypothetical protein